MTKKKSGHNSPPASEQLLLLFERIERLKEEVKDLNADIKDVFLEAKATGFDVATMREVLKLRAMTPDDRRHKLSMIELYMAAIGIGEGSLSDMAADFISSSKGVAPADDDDTATGAPEENDPVAEAEAAGRPPLSLDDATRLGKQASEAGRPVTANPFPARDPRRAAWDLAWCQAAGTDGMDIPDFLKSPPKPGKGDKADAKKGGE